MSKHKTAKERRRRRRIAKRAERRGASQPGVEIIAQSFRKIGDVAVTFTIGRINSSKGNNDGR